MEEDLCWGENYSNSERSENWGCTECNLDYSDIFDSSSLERIKGIGKAPYPGGFLRKDRVYAVMCECPNCFSHYWFHISNDLAEDIKNRKEINNQLNL